MAYYIRKFYGNAKVNLNIYIDLRFTIFLPLIYEQLYSPLAEVKIQYNTIQ